MNPEMPGGEHPQFPGQPQQPPYGAGQVPPYGAGGYPPPAPGPQTPYTPPGQQQPYTPPGQQAPYTPPGQQPPYTPPQWGSPYAPPPRQKPNRAGLYIFLSCLGVAALIAVIGVLVHSLSSGSSSSSSTAAASASAPAASATSATASASAAATGSATAASGTSGGVGTSFTVQDNSGDTYRVTLVKIIDPAQGANQFYTPGAGKRFVGTVFTVTAIKGSPQSEDANLDAVLVGSDGQSYSADFSQIAGYTNFSYGTIKVAQGQSATGAVTFQVPTGVTVSHVQWTPGGFGNTVEWNVG